MQRVISQVCGCLMHTLPQELMPPTGISIHAAHGEYRHAERGAWMLCRLHDFISQPERV